MESCRVYYKGEGGGFPQVRAVVSLVCPSCPWLVLAPKVLQLCTNHFLLVLCRSVWVIIACHFFLVPSQSSSTPLYPSIVLRARECAPIPCLPLFLVWDSHLSPSKSWECVRMDQLLGNPISPKAKLFWYFVVEVTFGLQPQHFIDPLMDINIFFILFLCFFKVGYKLCSNVCQPHGLILNYMINHVVHTLDVKLGVQIMICKEKGLLC